VGYVVDKVALEQVFSEYFDFLYQFSFPRLLHIHHYLSSGAGTIRQIVADVPSGLSLTASYQLASDMLLQAWELIKQHPKAKLDGDVEEATEHVALTSIRREWENSSHGVTSLLED
jgi:hypothetical protein